MIFATRHDIYPALMCTLALALSACSDDSSDAPANKAPEIGRVLTDIQNIPSGYGAEEESIAFRVNVEVADPNGFGDLEYIKFLQVDDNIEWYLLKSRDEENRENCRLDANIFSCNFYSKYRLHSIQLTDWKIIAEDKAGNVVEKPFQFSTLNGEAANDWVDIPGTKIIYSPKYSGDRTNTMPALESLSNQANGLRGEVNEAADSFRITFEATDTRIKNYEVELWANVGNESTQENPEWVVAGIAQVYCDSIISSPIVAGTLTTVDLSWSDISFRDGFEPTDISAAHVWVYDAFVQVEPDYFWAYHVGISEFFTFD